MKKRNYRKGMTLIELTIVIGILGVIFAAVYMFFTKGTEQFHFTRRQNNLATSGRLALEMLADEIIWAGYMPDGGWDEDEWHPVITAENGYFSFYADMTEPTKSLEDADYRHIFLDSEGHIRVTDNGMMNRPVGSNITSLQFNYLDGSGNLLSKPLSDIDRDAVRHIVIKLTLEDEYLGDVYQTVMQTMVTPRNLGVIHNFNPVFYGPEPPDAKIVVNINGTAGAHAPTLNQQALLYWLDDWGYTLVQLTDDELASYDYIGSGVDIVILRYVNDYPIGSHVDIAGVLQGIPLPIIALDPDDAELVFAMGTNVVETNGNFLMHKVDPNHHIHDHVPFSNPDLLQFEIYDHPGFYTRLDSLYVGTDLKTGFTADTTASGVCVVFEEPREMRRIHYCAPEFTSHSGEGLQFLYDVILWQVPVEEEPPLGDEIVMENFEGDPPEEVIMTFWQDSLEGGAWLPDSIVLYQDFQLGGTHEMMWSHISTGAGRTQRMADNVLQTDRTSVGATFDMNAVSTIVDLSNYDAFSDELYMRMRTWRGTTEAIDPEDGIFLVTGGGIQLLASNNFENLILGGGDVTFWSDAAGRVRVHSPNPDWGGNTTRFVTLDSEVSGTYSQNRMIFELDTSTLNDGTTISVSWLMADHGDNSHAYNPGTGHGDFVGWSLGSDVSDPIEGWQDLLPGTQSNGSWYGGNYSFTPAGAMPDTIFVVFGQYDDNRASSATAHAGLSFDDIFIVADDNNGSLYKIATPDASGGYNPMHIDLDDMALAAGVPFSENFAFTLSQGGYGPWAQYGILWKNFELGYIGAVYNAPGWDHGPVVAREKDDWILERVLGDHKYTLHANFLNTYSNEVDCWLESPSFAIPSGTIDPTLTFTHEVEMETGWDFGWIEVSTNDGETWTPMDAVAYNSVYDGHGAFTGYIPEQTVDISLEGYAGKSIKLRFLFHSDETGIRDGWALDDFHAYGTVAGVLIESIGFKQASPGGGWIFDTVDLYLGRTVDTFFPAGGELDKDLMTHCGTYTITPSASEWVVIDLPQPFILLAGTNLQVKLEMNQASTTSGYNWITAYRPDMVRDEQSPGGDPGNLQVSSYRPALQVTTTTYGTIFVDGDSTGTTNGGDVPLCFDTGNSDFEGIYLLSELGFTIDIDWIHGGQNDDWQIGAPIFIPDVDPALTASNENAIAGTDLFDDGLYNPDSWSWIMSPAYPLADAAAYDSIALGYDRCLRLALNDGAYIQMAFTDTVDPPLDADWQTVADYVYLDDDWEKDVVQLTEYFEDAITNGKNYYWVRFILYSGPFAEKGGWNIDNVGFFGRDAI